MTMPVQKLTAFLDKHKIKYVAIKHSPAYTAQEVAATAHIPGKDIAKTVMIKVEDQLAMAVLPAMCKVHLAHLKDITGCDRVELADEHEFAKAFPECELGAMPPFGNLYGMDVYVSDMLAADERIAFNAGSHTELIQMAYADFERLVEPKVVSLTY
jgi:Ala-tRNA(Pro) deacylase